MTENSKKSLFERFSIKMKRKFSKPEYGKRWPEQTIEWNKKIHDENYLIHEHFKKYLKSKNDVNSVLEIGCGKGIYPIFNKELFDKMEYTGIDISPSAVNYCKENSKFLFICDDFIKINLEKNFDLVYSHAVVDHVYDIDAFISKIIDHTNHHAFINSYRGYFPNLESHEMQWDGYEGCYFNQLSIKQIKKLLSQKGLSESEYKIYSQESGQKDENVNLQTTIEINKKS